MTQPKTDLAYLRNEKAKAEQKLRSCQHREKILEHQMSELNRRERAHRLCTRAGMLESFPAFQHECKDDAHALSGSALTSGVQGSSHGADKSAASALPWLFRCGDRQGRFSVGSWHHAPSLQRTSKCVTWPKHTGF